MACGVLQRSGLQLLTPRLRVSKRCSSQRARIGKAARLAASDSNESDAENAAAEALYKFEQVIARDAVSAMGFFSAGRSEARRDAHQLIAEIDSAVGNFEV